MDLVPQIMGGWIGATLFLVAGVGGWWLTRARRWKVGPGIAVAGVSLGLAVAVNQVAGHRLNAFEFAAHAGAGLCLLWAVWVALVDRHRPGGAPDAEGLSGAAQIGALASGLMTLVILIYVAVFEVLHRVINSFVRPGRPPFSFAGLLDLSAVVLAIVLVGYRRRTSSLVTPLFWTLCFGCLWGSLTLQPQPDSGSIGRVGLAAAEPGQKGWSQVLLPGLAAIVTAFVWFQGWTHRQVRRRAWPDKLHLLQRGCPHWPGLRYSVGVVAIVVIGLACMNTTWWGTVAACGVASGAVFYLAHREWNENLADAAAGLATLAVVSAVICLTPAPGSELTDRFPVHFNMAMLGMTFMTALWHWLSLFWAQQLLEGAAWTTTGRMIVIARRFGFIVAGLTLVVAMQMAVWPMLPMVNATDDSPLRMTTGLAAFLLLTVVLAWCASRTNQAALVVLALLSLAVAGVFLWVRLPPSPPKAWIADHWPLLLAVGSIPLGAAVGPLSRRATVFADPLIGLGIVVLPALSLAGIVTLSMQSTMIFLTLSCLAGAFTLLVLGTRVRPRE